MAAIDPSAEPQPDEKYKTPRATLQLIRERIDASDSEDEDDEDYDDIEAIKARLAGVISDDEDMSDEDSDDEKNGGPSDPAKSKKAKQEALSKKLKEELEAEEMELDHLENGANGKAKGKGKALDDEDISSDEEGFDPEEVAEHLVICTLDPEKVSLPCGATSSLY